jgi:predicted transcriptional regulator
MTLQKIADEIGLTREAVRLIINKRNGPSAKEVEVIKRKKLKNEIRQEMRKKQNPTASSVAESLGISTERVRKTLGREKKELILRNSVSRQRYSDEKLLEILRISQKEVDGPLSANAYSKLGLGPTVAVYYSRFGSWTKACEKAGVLAGKKVRKYERKHSDEDMLDFVRSYLADPRTNGSADGYDKWQKSIEDAPSLALIRQRLGFWNDVKMAALKRD